MAKTPEHLNKVIQKSDASGTGLNRVLNPAGRRGTNPFLGQVALMAVASSSAMWTVAAAASFTVGVALLAVGRRARVSAVPV